MVSSIEEFLTEHGGVITIGHKSVYFNGDAFACECLSGVVEKPTFQAAMDWLLK